MKKQSMTGCILSVFAVSLTRISSVQSLDRLGRWKDTMDDSAEILFQSFLQEALVSSPGMGRDVHSLMLSILHFLCRLWCRPPRKTPRRMVFFWGGGCRGV